MGDFTVDQLDGTGFTFEPGSYHKHELFDEGKLVQGIQISTTGEIISSSFEESLPTSIGYRSNINDYNVDCMDWDDDELTACGDNMRLKRYDNYETYYGQTKGWDQRHGFGEYKESDDCMEGMCYKGRWRNDNPHGFGRMIQSFQGILIGQFKKGKLDGTGLSISATNKFKHIYFGGWKEGKWEGAGVFIYPGGERVIGFFKDGKLARNINLPTPIYIDSDGNQQTFHFILN